MNSRQLTFCYRKVKIRKFSPSKSPKIRKKMALNFCRRINRSLARNVTRFLQEGARRNIGQVTIIENAERIAGKLNRFAISSRRRSAQPDQYPWNNTDYEHETEIFQNKIKGQYLQPATMPSYVDKPIFDKSFMDGLQEEPIKKAQNIVLNNNSASQQIYEALKKKQSKSHSSRYPKMTMNPFPDPVKAIFSPYTLCDREKADIMFQDHQAMMRPMWDYSRMTDVGVMKTSKKFYCTSALQGVLKMKVSLPTIPENATTMSTRLFASKAKELCGKKPVTAEEMCKIKNEMPKKCNKLKIPGCPPTRKNVICKPKIIEVKCKKIEAPYPSFSESCRMDPDRRESECNLCPWTKKKNPNFRGPVKIPPKFPRGYHSLCSASPRHKTNAENVEQKCPSQVWTQKANFIQIPDSGKDMPRMDFIGAVDPPKKPKLPIEIPQNKNKFEDDELLERYKFLQQKYNMSKLGYCDKHQTLLTDLFSNNEDLMKNYKDGDDLGEFGIEKTQLCKVLSSEELAGMVCKKPCDDTRIIPDYPRNCDRPPEDKTKQCPEGDVLTHRKTKKERLRKKTPKDK